MRGHSTAGLMQCDGSPGFPGQHGLSQDQITSMVRAGTNHFKQNLKDFGNVDTAECIYKVRIIYMVASPGYHIANFMDSRPCASTTPDP